MPAPRRVQRLGKLPVSLILVHARVPRQGQHGIECGLIIDQRFIFRRAFEVGKKKLDDIVVAKRRLSIHLKFPGRQLEKCDSERRDQRTRVMPDCDAILMCDRTMLYMFIYFPIKAMGCVNT